MMKSLILAFVVFAFAKAHADDTLNLFTFSTGGNSLQTNERYNVSKQQMLNVPLWNPETDAAPLEFSRALKLAKNWLRAKGADKICLTDYAVRSVGSRWYYQFGFTAAPGAAPLQLSHAIVLMDGTVVEPVVSTSVVNPAPTS